MKLLKSLILLVAIAVSVPSFGQGLKAFKLKNGLSVYIWEERSYEKASDDALQLLPRLREISVLPSPSRHHGGIRTGVVVSNASGSMESEAGAKGPAARSAEGRQKLSGHVPRQYVHQSRTQQRETQSSHSQYLGLG